MIADGVKVGGVVVTASVLAEAEYERAASLDARFPSWSELTESARARARLDAELYAKALVWIAEHPERFGGAR